MEKENRATAGEKLLVYGSMAVLVLVASFLGFQEIISYILLPALLAYSVVRFGFLHWILQSVLLAVVYSLVSGGYYEPIWLTILPGVCIGNCIRSERGLLYTVSIGALALLGSEMYIYFGNALREDMPMGFLESLTYQSTEMINSMGLPAKESALIAQMIQTYTPAILLLSLAMLSYAIVFVLLLCLKRCAPERAALYPRFRDLSVSRGSLLLWVVSWMISLFGSGVLGTVFANLATIISCYIIVCGYSLAVYRICKLQSVGWRVVLGAILIWLGSLLSPFAFFLGGLDAILHFRTRGGDRE